MIEIFISIIGSPNVGKSTFFNRMIGRRKSIIDAQEGITRDRIYGKMEWCNHILNFIDTGGYIPNDLDVFNSKVRNQAREAILESNLIIFMVDGRVGPNSTDQKLATIIRASGKPYIFVVNKCDELKSDNQINQFFEFGLDNPFPISALNGRNSGDLLDKVIKKLALKNTNDIEKKIENKLKLAIVGMPNVGKSSLTNALLKKERSIVTSVAGTTRDSVDASVTWYEKKITLIDTAGLRKLSKIKDKIEYYSLIRTQNAIYRSNIVILMIDAKKGFGKQDKSIVDETIKKGKGLIFIVNKWDLLKKDNNTIKNYVDNIRRHFKVIDHYPIIFISAKTKQRIHKVLETSWIVFQRINKTISTRILNDKLNIIINKNPPPSLKGKSIRIKYATHVSKEPFVIALYLNFPSLLKSSYKRYLENQIREYFNLVGVSIRLSFRKK